MGGGACLGCLYGDGGPSKCKCGTEAQTARWVYKGSEWVDERLTSRSKSQVVVEENRYNRNIYGFHTRCLITSSISLCG
jgi:hypothetical protein